MRRLAYALLLPLLFLSCAKEREMAAPWNGPVIELTLSCDDLGMTKVGLDDVRDGDNDYFENVVKWVDFFFYPVYPEGNGRSIKQPYHKRIELTNNVLTFRIEVTSNQVNNLIFPTDECEVFALVNVPKEKFENLDDLSLESLYSIVETTAFEKKTDSFNHRQSQFMMSGLETLTLSEEGGRTAKVVSRKIVPVARYACKITLGIKVDDVVKVDTGMMHEDTQTGEQVPIYEEWRPSVEEMYIYLVDGVKSVTLDGNPVDTDKTKVHEEDHPVHFSYKKNPMYFYEKQLDNSYKQIFDKDGDFYTTYPTYMYPQYWTGANAHVPYLKLVLPWVRLSDNLKKVCYYKIIIPQNRQEGVPDGKNAFLRNNWYHYNIAVGMLGADTDDAEVTVDPIDFFIYYWQDKNVVIKQASIGNARYLSVDKEYKESDEPEDQKFYELNNESSVDITYTSSHPISFDVLSVTRPYYGKNPVDGQYNETFQATVVQSKGPDAGDEYGDKLYPKGSYYLKYETSAKSGYINAGSWFTKYSTFIHFEHELNNTYTNKKFDYSPYTIFLSVQHADDPSTSKDYSKMVKIIQYPAVYIVAEENSDPNLNKPGINISGDPQDARAYMNFVHNGYVFVDGGPNSERYMRHTEDTNEGGRYGTIAKHLNNKWSATGNYAVVRKRLEWMQWRTVNFTGGNRNMYNIVVTVLPTNSPYVIGDPRTLEVETWNNGEESYSTVDPNTLYYNWEKDIAYEEYVSHFQKAHALFEDEAEGRELRYYFPADESDRTKNMLAPSYRVASKFGGLEYYNGVTKRSAEYKCATYQEDGYPAGRWRLPTKAEIDFIATLSAKGTFEVLFGATGKYWSAHGAVQPNAGIQNVEYALARCVYDSWYWDPLDDRLQPEERNNFVFGDMPR